MECPIVTEWHEGFTLYRNQGQEGTDHHWLTVRLAGGRSVNRDAIGTRVTVETAGGPVQMQEVHSGSSLGAGNEMALHFGLGSARQADVTMAWPDGTSETHTDVAADQIWHVAR